MNQNFLVKKLIEVFYKKLTKKAFDNLRSTTNTRRRNTLRLNTLKSTTNNAVASFEDNSKFEPITINDGAQISSSTKIVLKNTQTLGDKEGKSHTRPMRYGDIIYLTFDTIGKDGSGQKGIMMGKSLSGGKINAKYIDSSLYDSSMKKCLFQILSKSEIKEEQIFDKNQLMGLLMSQNDNLADKLSKHKKHEHEKEMSYTRNFGNFVLFGQSFALKHLHSNCYFSITHDELNIARNSLMINLRAKESEDCYLKFFPTSRVRNLGEVIRYGDFQYICKSSDKFVFVGAIVDNNSNKLALDASKQEFEWKINFFSSDEEFKNNGADIKASDIVQIYHSDYRGYLSLNCEKRNKKVTNQSYKFSGGTASDFMKKNSLNLEKIEEDKKNVYEVDFECTDNPSIFSYWEIKSENILDTSSLEAGKVIRLKNLVTGAYICIGDENNIKMVTAKPYSESLNGNLLLKQKISTSTSENFTYGDLFKIKSEATAKHIFIGQLAVSKKQATKWVLNDDLLSFDPTIDLTDRNTYLCKPCWGKHRTTTCMFKMIPANDNALFIYKLNSIKFFLTKFTKFLEVWGTKVKDNTYYIDYETSISDLNQLEEAHNNFNTNIRHLFDELLLPTEKRSSKEIMQKNEAEVKRQIGENLIDFGLVDIIIEIIKLIDFRLHKTCFKLVDYNDNTAGMKEFYKYKRLKNLINDKKFIELPQLVGKNVLNKIMVHSLQLLTAYGEVNENIKSRISESGELFVNLLFFFEDECIELGKLMVIPNKTLANQNDQLCEYFLDKFFYLEDNVQARVNATKFYLIISNIISFYSYKNNDIALNKIFNFFFKAEVTMKFGVQDGRVYFFMLMSEVDFEKFADKQRDLSAFLIDLSDRNSHYLDVVSIKTTMLFINSYIHAMIDLMKTFFSIKYASKEVTAICDYMLQNVISTATAFEILQMQTNYQIRSTVLELISHLLFYKQNVKSVTDFMSNYSLLFFTDVQQTFSRKKKPCQWINSPEAIKSLSTYNEKIVSCYLDFCSMMNKFSEIYTNKNEQELKYFKELLRFIQNCLHFGLYDFYQIKEIYEKILKFLHESIYDESAMKRTTVMYLSILKTQLVFTNKNKKINEWLHHFYEVEYHCYEILKLVNKFRLYYQINLLAKYAIKQNFVSMTPADLRIKCEHVFDILKFGPSKIETPAFVNLINQHKTAKKKSMFTSSNKIRSINETTFLKIVERKGKTQNTNIVSLNYHFEVKFLDYYQKNYEKIKMYTIFWRDHFDFNEVSFFSKQMHTLKQIPDLLLEIYSEYFNQRETLYKVFKQSQFMLNKNVYMSHDAVESFVSSANNLIKIFKGDKDNTMIQEHLKEVKKGYLILNKQLVQSYQQKIFFTKFQNYLSCMNLLHTTVDLLNLKKLGDNDLYRLIFKFLQLMLKDNQTNQLFLSHNFQNFVFYLLEGHSTSKIIVSLLSSVNNINEINKIIKHIFTTIDSILVDCNSIFDIFKAESSTEIKDFDSKIIFDKSKLEQISRLNELLIMIINVKDNMKTGKLKRVIFLCMMNNKKLENLFSIYEPRAMKSFIQTKKEYAREFIGFFNSYYMLISDVLKDCPFAINTFKNIISSEKFIYFFKLNRGHYIFKSSMLKIYSIVYLDESFDLIKYDYLTDILGQIISVDLRDCVYFLNGLKYFQNDKTNTNIIETFYAKLKISKNEEFNHNKSRSDERVLLKEIEYWGYIFTKSANQNYGLLYFTYDILNVLAGCMLKPEPYDVGSIAQTEQRVEHIRQLLNEIKASLETLKQIMVGLNGEIDEFPVRDYLFLVDVILDCIENINSGRNPDDMKNLNDGVKREGNMNLRLIRELKETILPTEERANLDDTQLSNENDMMGSKNFADDITAAIKHHVLVKKLDFYNFLNGFIFINDTSVQDRYSALLKVIGLSHKNYPYREIVKPVEKSIKTPSKLMEEETQDDFLRFLEFFIKLEQTFYKSSGEDMVIDMKYQELYNHLIKLHPMIRDIDSLTRVCSKFIESLQADFLDIKHAQNEIMFLKGFIKEIIFDQNKNNNFDHFLDARSLMMSNTFNNSEDGLFMILYCIHNLMKHEFKKKVLYKADENAYYRKITQVQNLLDTRKFTHLILHIISNYESQKLVMISIKILIDLLKYGNATVQLSIYNLITTDPKLANFLGTCKRYIKNMTKKLFTDLRHSSNSKAVIIPNFYEDLLVSFYGMNKCKLLTNFFMVFQNFCENCNSNFQLFLCNPEGVSNPINFVYTITEFFIKRSTVVINENYHPSLNAKERLRNKIFESVHQADNDDEELILQTYNTIEDFLLGPCENNQIALMNNKKLVVFLKDIINKDFEHIIQNYKLLVVFILSIKIICLLLNENNLSLLEKAKQIINADELMETLVLIYDNYVLVYRKQMFGENICTDADFYGEDGDPKTSCTKNKCLQGKLTALHMKIVETGFEVFKILRTIKHPKIDLYTNRLMVGRDNNKKINTLEVDAVLFFDKLLDQVEILYNGQIINVYFRIPYLCHFINKKITNDIIYNTERSSHFEKIENLVQKVPVYMYIMRLTQMLSRNLMTKFLYYNKDNLYSVKYLLIIAINLSLFFRLKYSDDVNYSFESDDYIGNIFNLIKNDTAYAPIYFGLSIVIIILSVIIIIFNLLDALPQSLAVIFKEKKFKRKNVVTHKMSTADRIQFYSGKVFKSIKRMVPVKIRILLYCLADTYFLFYAIMFVLTVLALIQPIFWGILLLEIIKRNSDMQNIVKSITINWAQLLKTAFLSIIVMYIYATIAFTYFPSNFSHDDNSDFKNYCNSLSACFSSTVYNGLRSGGGIGDALGNLTIEDEKYWARFAFDLTFFIIVIICLLNIIFGIIIDTFAALRDKKNEFNDLIANNCIICELKKFVIESKGEGWKTHILKSHNIESYLNFLVYIKEKKITDCTGVEKFVKESIKNNEYVFIPYLRSKHTLDNSS